MLHFWQRVCKSGSLIEPLQRGQGILLPKVTPQGALGIPSPSKRWSWLWWHTWYLLSPHDVYDTRIEKRSAPFGSLELHRLAVCQDGSPALQRGLAGRYVLIAKGWVFSFHAVQLCMAQKTGTKMEPW